MLRLLQILFFFILCTVSHANELCYEFYKKNGKETIEETLLETFDRILSFYEISCFTGATLMSKNKMKLSSEIK